jgi:hypothetical protein
MNVQRQLIDYPRSALFQEIGRRTNRADYTIFNRHDGNFDGVCAKPVEHLFECNALDDLGRLADQRKSRLFAVRAFDSLYRNAGH